MKINFSDRIGRKDLVIASILAQIIIWVPIFVLWAVVKLIDTVFVLGISSSGVASLLFLVVPFVLSLLLSLSIIIRRHHDLNQFWGVPVVTLFVLFVLSMINKDIGGLMSFIYFLYLAFSKSVDENNKYGKQIGYRNIWEKIGIKNEKQK